MWNLCVLCGFQKKNKWFCSCSP